MTYDYDRIIADYREKYNRLTQHAEMGSIERSSYTQVVNWIDQAVDREKTSSPKQRGFMVAQHLMTLAQAVPETEARRITRQCARDFNRDTGFEEWQF